MHMPFRPSAETLQGTGPPSGFARTVVNNGQAITRPDGYDDIAYLPTVVPMVADFLNEQISVALALQAANKRRIQTKFVKELTPSGKEVSRFLVRAYKKVR